MADGIVKLLRALAAVEQAPVSELAQARGYERYLGSSVKGEAAIGPTGRPGGAVGGIVADGPAVGRRRGNCPRTAMSGSGLWPCWASCRTWNGLRVE